MALRTQVETTAAQLDMLRAERRELQGRISEMGARVAQSPDVERQYLELVPNQRIRYNDVFDDANLPGVMEVTVMLKPVLCGTDVDISQAGIPEIIPLEMCYLGWQESLLQLAALVEPDIPG